MVPERGHAHRDGDGARLRSALEAAGVSWSDVTGCDELGGGTFNTVFRVRRAGGAGLVVKLAPDPGVPILRYERGILATEARFYALAREQAGVPVPAVLRATGGAKATVPGPGGAGSHGDPNASPDGHLVMTECPGRSWFEVRDAIGRAERRRLRAALGAHVAALHTVTGPAFGYPSEPFGPLRATWRAAFLEMVDAVLGDAGRFGVSLPRPAGEIRGLFDARGGVLDDVTSPRLVHFDLWDGNILVEQGTGEPRISALVDAERAFWGDPLADFVSLALFGDIEHDEDFLTGYRSAGGPVTFDGPARERLALYRAYMYLIMWVEAVPRGFADGYCAWLSEHVLRPLTATFDAWAAWSRA